MRQKRKVLLLLLNFVIIAASFLLHVEPAFADASYPIISDYFNASASNTTNMDKAILHFREDVAEANGEFILATSTKVGENSYGGKFFEVITYVPSQNSNGTWNFTFNFYIVKWPGTNSDGKNTTASWNGYAYPDKYIYVYIYDYDSTIINSAGDGVVSGTLLGSGAMTNHKITNPSDASNRIFRQGVHKIDSVTVSNIKDDGLWLLVDDGAYTPGTSMNSGDVLGLRKLPKGKKYDISYDLNDGNWPSDASVKYTYNESDADIAIPNPQKTGYSFTGWTEKLSTSFWHNARITPTTGEAAYSSSYKSAYTSEYIRVEKGVTYTINGIGSNKVDVNFYNSSKTALTSQHFNSSTSTTFIPEQDGYVRFCFANGHSEGIGALTTQFNITSDREKDLTIYSGSKGHRHYTAIWEKIPTYMVTYKANGGIGEDVTQTIYQGTKWQAKSASTFTRTGYTLSSWNTKADGSGTKITPGLYQALYKNVTLYAQWSENTYTVKYYVDGSLVETKSDINYTDTFTLRSATNKTGYTWTGWNTSSSFNGTAYNPGSSVSKLTSTNGATISLYGKNTVNNYTANFDANGGKEAIPTSITKAYGSQLGTLPTTSRIGYTFNGWYTAKTGGTKISTTTTMPLNGATYYAQWTPAPVAYKVEHYQMNTSGSYPTTATATDSLTANTGSSVTPTLKYTTGFTLDTEKSTKTPVTISADGSTVIKYYYKRNQHTVTVDKGAGIDSVSGGGKYYYGSNVSVSASVNGSYKWNNWTGTYTSTNNPYSFSMPDQDVSLTANGTINTSSLTVKPNGGTWNSKTTDQGFTQTIGSTKSIENPVAPTGYEFNGWVHSGGGTWNDSTKEYTFGTSNGTLTAKYKGKTLTLSYDANGGNGAPEKQTWTYGGDDITISSSKPTRTGYTFLGWSTSSTATNADSSLDPKDTVSSTKWSTNTTLYAVWKNNSYTITAIAGTGIQSVIGEGSYNYGESVTMGVTLKDGYKWDANSKWSSSNTTLLANSTTQAFKFNMPAGDVTLTASASPIHYTVEYYKDGTLYKTVSATYDKAFTIEAAPTVETGYLFSGWYTSSDLTGKNFAAESSQKNLTTTDGATIKLYGKTIAQSVTYKVQHWQEKLNVTPTAENSTYYTLVSEDTRIFTATAGSKVSPEVNSYIGFKSPSKKTVTVAGDGSTVINYYYTRNSYTVSLKIGDGVSSVSGEGTYDYGATVSVDAIVKENNTWACWISSDPELVANSTEQKYTFTMPDGNVILTATADATAFTVAFDANGGTEVSTILEKKEGEVLGELPLTTREGFVFEGWFTEKTEGTKISESTKMPASNVTYYAHWTVIPPELQTKKAYYFQDAPVTSVDLAKNAKASDIVDGDISSEVVIHKIKYPNGTEKVAPTTLDTSELGEVIVEYKVSNERGAEVKEVNTVTIVKKGSSLKEDTNQTNVYFRFISNLLLSDGVEALDTLEEHSIWATNSYNQLLRNSLNKNKGDYLVEYEYINE